MNQFLGYRALRRGRVSIPGHVYLLTTVVSFRQPLFRDVVLARSMCRTIHEQDSWGDAELLCWVLMPDH
jgi:hypothetical protein